MKRVEVKSRNELRAWLKKNHKQTESIWLVTYKKKIESFYVSYDELVEEALCFGWIDSLPRKLDDKRTMTRLSPRKSTSAWSQVNKLRVEKLMKLKLMNKAGLEVVKLAKKSGTWDKLNEASSLKTPHDLVRMFHKFEGSKRNFESFPPSSKRAILEWISAAKTKQTRLKRVTATAKLAKDNIRANHHRQPKRSKMN